MISPRDTSYSYEDTNWYLYRYSFGEKEFRRLVSDIDVNCQGYAMFVNSKFTNLAGTMRNYYEEYIDPYVTTQNVSAMKTAYLNEVKEYFEFNLSQCGFTYAEESNFVKNGESTVLSSNQYRIVLRVGLHLINENADSLNADKCRYDYHFWYQTADGRWAHKNGTNAPVLLPWGVTPSSYEGGGWMLDGDNDFYDSDIYSYIVTPQ